VRSDDSHDCFIDDENGEDLMKYVSTLDRLFSTHHSIHTPPVSYLYQAQLGVGKSRQLEAY
jgi:hypothetical protein